MHTYIIKVPEWRVSVEAETEKEALEIAGNAYDNEQALNPDFGKFIIKELKP
jgi:hypothetical protein